MKLAIPTQQLIGDSFHLYGTMSHLNAYLWHLPNNLVKGKLAAYARLDLEQSSEELDLLNDIESYVLASLARYVAGVVYQETGDLNGRNSQIFLASIFSSLVHSNQHLCHVMSI